MRTKVVCNKVVAKINSKNAHSETPFQGPRESPQKSLTWPIKKANFYSSLTAKVALLGKAVLQIPNSTLVTFTVGQQSSWTLSAMTDYALSYGKLRLKIKSCCKGFSAVKSDCSSIQYLIKYVVARFGCGCGEVGRSVTSKPRDLWFESCHQQFSLLSPTLKLCWKDKKKKKEAGNGPFLKIVTR